MLRRATHFLLLPLLPALIVACAGPQIANPSFPITEDEARADLARMEADPRPMERPLVVLGGWRDPGFSIHYLRRELDEVLEGQPIVGVAFPLEFSFDGCLEEVREELVEAGLPVDVSPSLEVDVVAMSMGGLVARYAARDVTETALLPPLRIERLFTIATPHQGAKLAHLGSLDPLARCMKPDAEFLRDLDEALAEADYELICYARLNDGIVGAENTAPEGMVPWWVHCGPWGGGHHRAYRDPRILADIARRLRGEEPLATGEPAALPGERESSSNSSTAVVHSLP